MLPGHASLQKIITANARAKQNFDNSPLAKVFKKFHTRKFVLRLAVVVANFSDPDRRLTWDAVLKDLWKAVWTSTYRVC
jgi:hypothetical protein